MTTTATAAPDAEAAALLAKAAELDAAGTPPPIDPATGQPPVPVDYAGEAEMLLNLGVTMAGQFWPCVPTIWTADKQKAVAAAAAPVMEKYGFTLGDFMGAYKEEIGLLFVAGPLVLQTLDAVKAEKLAARRAPKPDAAPAPAGGLDLSGADPES